MSANGRDVTRRAIIDVNYIVSERNYEILTSIIAQLLTSRPFHDLCRNIPLPSPVLLVGTPHSRDRPT